MVALSGKGTILGRARRSWDGLMESCTCRLPERWVLAQRGGLTQRRDPYHEMGISLSRDGSAWRILVGISGNVQKCMGTLEKYPIPLPPNRTAYVVGVRTDWGICLLPQFHQTGRLDAFGMNCGHRTNRKQFRSQQYACPALKMFVHMIQCLSCCLM